MFVCPECGQLADRAGHCGADGSPFVARHDPLLGTEVDGRYRIVRLLREGGLGRAYLAVLLLLGRRVVIKVLADEHAVVPELVSRFMAEARIASMIAHEAIVCPIDMGALPGSRPFIATEYFEGQTLDAYVHGRHAPLGGVVQIMLEVLSALSAVHEHGIVHRDLKPANILVTPGGRAKLLDFSVAGRMPDASDPSPPTPTGALYGTPAYMSPEQASAGAIDARTDVYIAGSVLYEAVTGRVPFRSETFAELMQQLLEEPPPPPRSLRPDLPPALEAVILTALAKAPAHRFPTAAAMADALRAAAAELPPSAQRPLA